MIVDIECGEFAKCRVTDQQYSVSGPVFMNKTWLCFSYVFQQGKESYNDATSTVLQNHQGGGEWPSALKQYKIEKKITPSNKPSCNDQSI